MFTKMSKLDDVEAMREEIDRLKKELNKAQKSAYGKLSFKVSPKKAISVYGLQRMPVTLYAQQWQTLLRCKKEILQFIEDNSEDLAWKEQEE